MARSQQNLLSTLANLITEQDGKRLLVSGLKRMADDLHAGQMIPVTGELALLQRLEEHLTTSRKILQEIGEGAHTGQEILGDFRATLEGPEWEVATGNLEGALKQKMARQQEYLVPYLERLSSWEQRLDDLSKLLAEALRSRAPIRNEQNQLKVLADNVSTAKRARDERSYLLFQEKLDALNADPTLPDRIRDGITKKIHDTESFSKQSDLLLIQSPLDEKKRYHYTMLLRTASSPGSQGINIQDSSTLVQQDRDSMAEIISKVTDAIDDGLARGFVSRKVNLNEPGNEPPPPAEPAASPAASPSPSPGTPAAGAIRNFSIPLPPDSPVENLNALLEDMGDLMFRLFMPEWTQRYLEVTPCSVMITTNDLALPWELMHCNGDFLCLQRPTSRMPMGRVLPSPRPVAKNPPGTKIRFLLIHSDPTNNLSHAQKEIEILEKRLREEWQDGIEVVTLTKSEVTGKKLNDELRRGNFDVIHYAGHASFDEVSPDLSGLLVGKDRDNSEVFFAQKVRRLLKGKPLVFLNACESAMVANENIVPSTKYLLQPAEGLASAFLYGGALACIGSLWPIYDEPAAKFALEFYRKALDGYMLGEAMRQARLKIRSEYPNQVTWAAFALYGDATMRLAR